MQRYVKFRLPAFLIAVTLVLASCAGSGGGSEQDSSESDDEMQEMNHGSESTDASEMLMENGKYSDERFIDAMVPHHQEAIDMAQVALENAEHPEILALAKDIV